MVIKQTSTDVAAPVASSVGPGLRISLILGLLLAFASISTDLFLPALPQMSAALGASQGALQLTISTYLVGFGLGQLFWGPVSDRYGRRGPIALGMLVFVIGSSGCALSASAWQLIGWRVVQALGACAAVVLARAMVRDLYDRDRAARLLSTLMTIMAIAPLVGPGIGGQILRVAPWQAIFWTLVAIGFATLAAVFVLPETLPPERRERMPLAEAFAGYGELFSNRRLLCYAGALGFFYSGLFASIASTPFAYITYHHLSPQLYGAVFAVSIVGLMITNFFNARLVTRLGSDTLLRFGATAAALAGLIIAAVSGTDWGGLTGLAASVILFHAMNGFISANSIAGALSSFPSRSGAVSALIGSIQYGSGVVGSVLVSALADGTPRPLGWVMALSGIGSLACALMVGVGRRG